MSFGKKPFGMCLLMILLLSACAVELEGKTKGKQSHQSPPKQKHRQWLKRPLYIRPGEHFIDESIQPRKDSSPVIKKFPGIGHKTISGPNPFYQYRTGQTGFMQIPVYNTKTGQVGFALVPMYNAQTGKAGSKIPNYNAKSGQAGFAQIPMYNSRTGKTGFRKTPLYYTKTGQAGLAEMPMNKTKTGKTRFRKNPIYNAKTGHAGFAQIPMYNAKTGKTGLKKLPVYNSKTGQASYAQIPIYSTKTGFARIPKYNMRSGKVPLYTQADLNQIAMYQMMSGQPASSQLASIPETVPRYNTQPSIVPDLNSARLAQQMIEPVTAPFQRDDTPLLPASQMTLMYPAGISGGPGLYGLANDPAYQEGGLPSFSGSLLALPLLQANDVLAQSMLDQANGQVKSIVSAPKTHEDNPSYTVSVDGVSIVKQGDAEVNFDAGGASISLSKKNKVLKLLKKKKP